MGRRGTFNARIGPEGEVLVNSLSKFALGDLDPPPELGQFEHVDAHLDVEEHMPATGTVRPSTGQIPSLSTVPRLIGSMPREGGREGDCDRLRRPGRTLWVHQCDVEYHWPRGAGRA